MVYLNIRIPLRYHWIWWATNTAAGQLQWLLFGGHCQIAGSDHRRMWSRQHGQIVELLMDIRARSLRLDAALKASIIPIIRCVFDLQIVNSATGSEVQAESTRNQKENKQWVPNKPGSHLLTMCIAGENFFLMQINIASCWISAAAHNS